MGKKAGVTYSRPDKLGSYLDALRLAGIEPVKTAPPMDVLWFRLPKSPSDPAEAAEIYIGGGRFAVLLDRGDQWQVGCAILKGSFSAVRAAGIDALRGGLADVDFTLELVQIREGFTRSEFRIAGTRRLLDTLPPTSLLDAADVATLRDAHDFLRRLETLARLASDTHVSALPAVPVRLEALGRQMAFGERAGEELLSAIQKKGDAVRTLFETVITRL